MMLKKKNMANNYFFFSAKINVWPKKENFLQNNLFGPKKTLFERRKKIWTKFFLTKKKFFGLFFFTKNFFRPNKKTSAKIQAKKNVGQKNRPTKNAGQKKKF